MRRFLAAALIACAALLCARLVATRQLEKGLLRTHTAGSRTPATPETGGGSRSSARRGDPPRVPPTGYEDVRIPSGDRVLRAYWVPPPRGGPAVLLLHGRGESISGWVRVQQLLRERGVGSLVFDYSGFGASTGEPRLAYLREDATAAWAALRARHSGRACAYGLSLGSGVLLDVAAALQPDCVVVYGAFVSARAAAAHLEHLPDALAALLLPDVLPSERNAAHVTAPLLVQHGDRDELFPVDWGRRISAAAPHGTLQVLAGYTHAQPVVQPDATAWDPVARFVRGDTAPQRSDAR